MLVKGQDIALVDDILAVHIGLHHALGLVPGDLMQHLADIEPLLGIGIGDAQSDVLGRLAGVFGEDRQNFGRCRPVEPLAVGAGEGVVIVARRGDRRAESARPGRASDRRCGSM